MLRAMTLFTVDNLNRASFKMPFSDYSQRIPQNQVDLVRRFSRVVTQRIGARVARQFFAGEYHL
jgi:hypothetical protein